MMCEPWLTFIKFFRDLLDVLLSHQMKADPSSSFYGKLGYYGILNDYIELFFAGMETTTSSLMWCFLYLLHHPDIQSRIHNEIDDVVGRGRLPSLEDKNEMYYTQAFLLEAMR